MCSIHCGKKASESIKLLKGSTKCSLASLMESIHAWMDNLAADIVLIVLTHWLASQRLLLSILWSGIRALRRVYLRRTRFVRIDIAPISETPLSLRYGLHGNATACDCLSPPILWIDQQGTRVDGVFTEIEFGDGFSSLAMVLFTCAWASIALRYVSVTVALGDLVRRDIDESCSSCL